MRPARSFALVCAACLFLALVQSREAAAFQQTDLQGTWEINGIASGPGAPWWERTLATVAASGAFTAYSTDNTGGSGSFDAAFGLSPAGVIGLVGSGTFRGALDVGTTVLVATDTWSGGAAGTTEMKLGLKRVGGYSVSDLVGAWEVNTIASGPEAPWWQRGRIAIAGDGSISGTFTDDQGVVDPVTGAFVISPEGVLGFSGSSTARGVMDAGKTVVAMTSTWNEGVPATVDLSVAVKMAPAYAIADLAGTWEVHSLATGPGAPWWSRGQITIAANGSFTGSMLESTGGGGPVAGTFTISPTGVLARAGASTARGVLDAGKSVMVWTSTWTGGSPGTSELMVAVRTGGSTLAVDGAAGTGFALEPVRPNPARGAALTVGFTLPRAGGAQLEMLDVSGRRVRAREVGSLGAGRHVLELGSGAPLAPGLYLVRLRQGASVQVRRVAVL